MTTDSDIKALEAYLRGELEGHADLVHADLCRLRARIANLELAVGALFAVVLALLLLP